MPAAICSPRVIELTQRRDELSPTASSVRPTEGSHAAGPHARAAPALCTQVRRIIEDGNLDPVKQLLRELIDRVEITPERHAYPYFWVPAGCESNSASGMPGPNAQPVPSYQEDTGWLFVIHQVEVAGVEPASPGILDGTSPSALRRRCLGSRHATGAGAGPQPTEMSLTARRRRRSGKPCKMTPGTGPQD